MKSNSNSRVTEALAILNESAEEFTFQQKPKRGGVSKSKKIKKITRKTRK